MSHLVFLVHGMGVHDAEDGSGLKYLVMKPTQPAAQVFSNRDVQRVEGFVNGAATWSARA